MIAEKQDKQGRQDKHASKATAGEAAADKADRQDKLKEMTAIAERRGFFFPTAEIYGGKAGFYTYGHLGKLMKNNFENLWRNYFLEENCYEIEGNTILPEDVFKASGHLKSFTDPLTECKACHFRFRADQLIEDVLNIKAEGLSIEDLDKLIRENKLKCPKCNLQQLTKVEWFNMMFPITIGAVGSKEVAYLSPETAQNPYLAFKREFEALRKKLPLGIAMIGKAYRNEISPRQLFFRLREFTQAELQNFIDPEEINNFTNWKSIASYKLRLLPVGERKKAKIVEMSCEEANKKLKLPKLYLYYMQKMQRFFLEQLKIPPSHFRFYELSEEERAFYNKYHWDVQINLETLGGFKEVAGLHYRTDHDLAGHQPQSKKELAVYLEEKKKKILPHVIEVSFGVDRNVFAFLDIFFKQEQERNLFSFPSKLAPIEVGIFPLVSKDGLPEKARVIYEELRKDFLCFYDEDGSIGKRYRRIDEIGVPLAITIDYDSLKKNDVTIRDRDSMKQERIKISALNSKLREILNKV